MSLLQDSQIQTSVYICTFQCFVREAAINMKFPCTYFVEWSTANGKSVVSTPRHRPQQNRVYFNQKLNLTTQMIFNHKTLEYSKKQTLVELYLVSKSRPDQNKLVGRVTIDLSKIINVEMYAQPTQFKLNFCSVQGNLTMQFILVDQKLTSMKVQDLDRSSFIDYISQVSFRGQKKVSPIKDMDASYKQKELISSYQAAPSRRSQPVSALANMPKRQSGLLKNGSVVKSESVENDRMRSSSNPLQQEQVSSLSKAFKRMTFGNNQNLVVSINPGQLQSTEERNKPDLEQKSLKALDDRNEQQPKSDRKFERDLINLQRMQQQFKEEMEAGSLPIQQRIQQNKITFEVVEPTEVVELEAIEANQLTKAPEEVELLSSATQNIEIATKQVEHSINVNQQQLLQLRELCQNKEIQLKHLNEQFTKEISSKDSLISSLNNQLAGKQQRIAALESTLKQNQQQFSTLTTSYQQLSYSHQQLQQNISKIQEYERQISSLSSQLSEFQSKDPMLQQKMSNLEAMVKDLEAKNRYQNDLLHSQQQIKNDQSNKINQLQKINSHLRAQLISREGNPKAIDQLKEDLNMPMEERNGTNEDNEVSQLKTSLMEFQQRNKELEEQFTLILAQYQKKKEEYDILSEQHQLLDQQHQRLVEQYRSQVQRSQQQTQQLDFALPQTSPATEEVKDYPQDMYEQINKLNQEIQFLKTTLEMNQKQFGEQTEYLRNENNDLQSKLSQALLQLEQLQLSNPSQQNSPQFEPLQQDVEAYQEQIRNLSDTVSNYSTLLNEQKMRNTELTILIQKQEEKASACQHQLQQENNYLRQKIEVLLNRPAQTQPQGKGEEQWLQRCQQYEMRISKLNSNLEEQINQNNELSETVIKFIEKQAKMKQTLSILEQQSKQIFVLFQEKEHNEETYQSMIENLHKEIDRMKENMNSINQEHLPHQKFVLSPKGSRQRLDNIEELNNNRQQLIGELTDELQVIKANYSSLKEEYQALIVSNSSLNEKNEQLSIMKNDFEQIQVQLQQSKQLQSGLEATIIKLQTQISDLQSKLFDQPNRDEIIQDTVCRIGKQYQAQIEKLKQQIQEQYLSGQQWKQSSQRYESELFNKMKQMQVLKNQNKVCEQEKVRFQQLLNEIAFKVEYIEEEKFGLQSENNEKDIKILQLQQQIHSITSIVENLHRTSRSQLPQDKLAEMYSTFIQFRDKLVISASNAEWQSLMKNILDRSICGEQTMKIINIEQKSRLLSKELQKVKSQLLKSDSKKQQQKLNYMILIKKCESIIAEIISAAESLNLNQSSFL